MIEPEKTDEKVNIKYTLIIDDTLIDWNRSNLTTRDEWFNTGYTI